MFNRVLLKGAGNDEFFIILLLFCLVFFQFFQMIRRFILPIIGHIKPKIAWAKANPEAARVKAKADADAVSEKAEAKAWATYEKAETEARLIYNKAEKTKGK